VGLEVLLEGSRPIFVSEGDRDLYAPGRPFRSVANFTPVVPPQPVAKVAGEADVVASGIGFADQKVDVCERRQRRMKMAYLSLGGEDAGWLARA
jgi:hypothetical protein